MSAGNSITGNNGIMHIRTESPQGTSRPSLHVAEPGDGSLLPARYPLLRPRKGRVISGVCRGIALHLGMRTWVVRLIALAMIPFFGAGFVAYVLLTISVRAGDPTQQTSNTDTLQNQPLAKGNVSPQPSTEHGIESDEGLLHILSRTSLPLIILGFGVVLLCFSLLLAARGLPVNVIVPVLLTACGMGISWLHIDDKGGNATNDSSLLTRLIVGIGLIVAALVIYAFSTYAFMQAAQLVFIAALLLTGVGTALVPWANSMVEKLSAEHALKEREEERADMTAHLHDGVLQTLALIQLHADEATVVSTLARSQERSLRDWLYHNRTPAERSVSAGIRDIAAQIEIEQGKAIEVVAVSDVHPSERSEALLDATRQALLNAAMHGGEPISVYSEAHDDVIDVFVRDHGDGFDIHAIPRDRLGIRESIVGRLERKGGSVEIVSRPHWGTEVRMRMPLIATAETHDGATAEDDGIRKDTGISDADQDGRSSN
ncbi:ATP-binding protein [Bifidobacterium aquikefiri]|uniref:ATP-binding protein n=2 Tax=Bifidobacterium aquikefiri TaxID=1653207 RepID=UPI0023F50369|nr:ATP-binding protein [Bifidobacterium aquikefiri]